MSNKFKTILDRDLYEKIRTDLDNKKPNVFNNIEELNNPVANILLDKSIQTGSVFAFTGNQIPEGWLLCNGLAISRSTYSNLFNIIGISHGRGDNLTTFNLPNYQGLFLRGRANGSGNDPNRTTRGALATGGATGDNVGSYQDMDWKGFSQTNTGQNTRSYSHGPVYMGKSTTSFTGNLFVGGWSSPAAAMGTLWDTSEIRPRNVYVNYIIKFSKDF
jgi:microcystin-dependent protein